MPGISWKEHRTNSLERELMEKVARMKLQ